MIQGTPTLIEFILDETGSMQLCKNATITGFNDFVEEQKSSDTCLLTLTKFNTSRIITPYTDIDLSYVIPMNEHTFDPDNGTNLRDAIEVRISATKNRISTWSVKPKILMIVMTDGQDNASKFSESHIKNLISQHTNEEWTFVYLGANADEAVARRLGFQDGNIKQFDTTRMYETMKDLSSATTAFRSGQSTQYFAA